MGVFLVQTDGVCTEVWVFGLFAALKVSLMQYFGFACPKIGEKGTAHRRTFGKAAPRVICVSKLRWESAGHEIGDFLPYLPLLFGC